MLNKYENIDVRKYPYIIERELDRIRKSEQKYDVDVLSSCLAVTSMALHICKKFWPSNTQLVSYCLLIDRRTNKKGRLLEILTGEGKSCVIAMVAATYALLGRTVDIVTSSPVLSQRDAEEWHTYFNTLELDADCNVEDRRDEDNQCYRCLIVYGTVETFARDILKTEFLIQDVRKGRKCDIVIVDEVDSMLIDQGVQCTYLSHDVTSIGLCHIETIFSLIWVHVSRFVMLHTDGDMIWYITEPEVVIVTLSRLSKDMDPLQILRLAEEDESNQLRKGFTDEYSKENIEGQKRMLLTLKYSVVKRILLFAKNYLNLNIDIHTTQYPIPEVNVEKLARISILVLDDGLCLVVLPGNMMKDRLTGMIEDAISNKTIDLPSYLINYCNDRLQYWIDSAFVARGGMQSGRDYIVDNNAVYPVDFKSTGVIETNKKWGNGLQQFLEMKHGLPLSPFSLMTNFLSSVDFFDRYRDTKFGKTNIDILGVSGTLGNQQETKLMSEAFSVTIAKIPASKRRKSIELSGVICKYRNDWLTTVIKRVESAIASQRAVLVISENIETAEKILKKWTSNKKNEATLYSYIRGNGYDGDRMNKELKPGDVVITTNLGARGTDFVTDDTVNKNGGLFVLVTFIPLNDRVEKQAFGRTGRRGAAGSCEIIVYKEAMPKWLRSCETVDEAKRLRDFIEMHRLINMMSELTWMRNKQKLFREYCELKKEFVKSSDSESDDLEIQEIILDESWAKYIQKYEGLDHESNHVEMIPEMSQMLRDCSKRARAFESDNIYHIMKFGAVRLMKGDFPEATEFYDQVIRMDPDWSAFAHYNRAYCTLQIKGDGYIRRAIDDLEDTIHKLEAYKNKCLFFKILVNAPAADRQFRDADSTYLTKYNTMMECQLLHHIDTHIIENIETLKTIDTMEGEVTIVERNILALIPGADCETKKMLQEYQQMGLVFIYCIGKEPTCCYKYQIANSLALMGSMAEAVMRSLCSGIYVNCHSLPLKNMMDAECNIGPIGDESFEWVSRCVSRAILIGIELHHFIRDISSLVPIETELESNRKLDAGTSQYRESARSQAISVWMLIGSNIQEMKQLQRFQEDELSVICTDIVKTIGQTIQENLSPGQELYRVLGCLYGRVKSYIHRPGSTELKNCFRDLSSVSVELQNITAELLSKYQNVNINAKQWMPKTHRITAADIEIRTLATKLAPMLVEQVNKISGKTEAVECFCDDVLETMDEALTSILSDNIEKALQNTIRRTLMFNLEKQTRMLFESDIDKLSVTTKKISNYPCFMSSTSVQIKPSRVSREILSSTIEKYAFQLKRALLRLDMNHPTRQMNQCEYVELDSSHLFSSIEQALKSENVSQLAKVLAEYESGSRSAYGNSPEHGTEMMTSPVSRDACNLFLFSGSSVKAEVYRQLAVERILAGDITTALKLCYIGHQMPLCQDNMDINRPISDDQTLRDTFDRILKIESYRYEQEISKFVSICDEWYRVLEPQGLMNIEQRELLREWISTRQYANTEDLIVSLVIEQCSEPKKEEEEEWQEAKTMRLKKKSRESELNCNIS